MNQRRRPSQTPRRPSLAGLPRADVAAAVGLVVIGVLSFSLLTGRVPIPGGSTGTGGPDGGPLRTATPSNIVIVDPRSDVLGSILYVKSGNLWLQHGAKATALTTGGHDSMPSFSTDGQWIYFIRTVDESGRWRISGQARRFRLSTPSLMRVRVDGTAEPEQLLLGKIVSGQYSWSYFLRQPVISPDGSQIVVVTDGPDPSKSDVVLKAFDPATGKLTALKAPQISPLGHQDPAFSPDGRYLAFVKNARDGARGAPVVMRYDFTTGKATAITGPGYTSPAWSPDGRFLAATRTTSFGTDVVVLDALRGTELLRVTSDEHSFDPVWSPAGDAISYLSISGGVTDLYLATLDVTGVPALKGDPLALTDRRRPRCRLATGMVDPGRAPPDARPDANPDPHGHRARIRRRAAERLHGAVTGSPKPTYLERLAARSVEVGSVLCLGIDPDIASLPSGFARNLAGLESFARLLVEVASPYAAAVKPNLAFFEAHGSAGMAALERIRADHPGGDPGDC